MSEPKINAVIVQRGNYYMGMTRRKQDGTTEEKQPPRWEPDAEGAAVIVCAFDTEKDETIGDADIFAYWDTVGIEKRVHERLALTRRNFPTPEELYKWVKEWDDRDIDLCEICEAICAGYDCSVCPIQAIKNAEDSDQ